MENKRNNLNAENGLKILPKYMCNEIRELQLTIINTFFTFFLVFLIFF